MDNARPDPAVPRAAATTIVFRPADRDRYEIFLARRSATARFMPNASVFPGGAVDRADPSAAHAALRELFEEAGVLLVRDAADAELTLGARETTDLRAALGRGTPLDDLLAREDRRLDVARLRPYSRWVTPASEPIRFDARFYTVRVPAGTTAEADGVELHDGRWLEPARALDLATEGLLLVTYPTLAHLRRLAARPGLAELERHVAGRTSAASAVEPTGLVELDDAAW